jgi:hypothetical protein
MLVDDGHFQIVDIVFGGKGLKFTVIPVAAEDAAGGLTAFKRTWPVFFAGLAMEADKAWTGMAAQQEFDYIFAEIDNIRGRGFHHHTFRRRRGAGWRVSPHAFNLNNAESAGTVRFQRRVIAESGDLDSGLLRRVKNRVSWLRFNLNPVNRKGYFTHS